MTTKQAKQKRQNRLGTVLAILIFLLGLGILFYPVASDLWNQHRQNQLISHYTQSTTTLAPEDHSALWEAAQEYNKNLSPTFRDAFTGRQLPAGDPYWGLLDPDGSGIMGYIEIPRISVRLPIYHGTTEEVLQHGIGHLGGTSLPVGGEGTHAVFSGHRGLPSALLFSDLDQMQLGDHFSLRILGEQLLYEVDQILVVEPDEVKDLYPVEGEDLVTLVTWYALRRKYPPAAGARAPHPAGDRGGNGGSDRDPAGSTQLGLEGQAADRRAAAVPAYFAHPGAAAPQEKENRARRGQCDRKGEN